MLSFGQTLKRERLLRGWTLDELARRIRTSKGYISGVETGHVNPPAAKLTVRIAKLLKLPAKELILLAVVEKAPRIVQKELVQRLFGRQKASQKPAPLEKRDALEVRRLLKLARIYARQYGDILKQLRGRL